MGLCLGENREAPILLPLRRASSQPSLGFHLGSIAITVHWPIGASQGGVGEGIGNFVPYFLPPNVSEAVILDLSQHPYFLLISPHFPKQKSFKFISYKFNLALLSTPKHFKPLTANINGRLKKTFTVRDLERNPGKSPNSPM